MSRGSTARQRDDGVADGRLLRAARTRQLVVESFLDLLDAGEPQPTAQQVSDRCGVSMRSIFRLFDDVEAMHGAAIATQIDRVAHLIVPLVSDGPLDRRIKALVGSRAKLFEAISPVRRMAVRLAPTSRPIRADLELANEFFRAQLVELFDAELTAVSTSRRGELIAALDAVTSWETWERLRGIQEVSERRARGVVTDLVRATLTDATRRCTVPTKTGARP